MKKVYYLTVVIMVLVLSVDAHAWRIERNKLIIEKGDNLWNISHNLRARGIDYKVIWDYNKNKYKDLTTNPSLIYDGMELDIPDSILGYFEDECCLTDSTAKIIKHLSSIDENVDSIKYELNNPSIFTSQSNFNNLIGFVSSIAGASFGFWLSKRRQAMLARQNRRRLFTGRTRVRRGVNI